MPDRIDAMEDGMQTAAGEAVDDRATLGAEVDELPPRDDAVLPRREVRDLDVQRPSVRFDMTVMPIRTLGSERP